MGSESRLNQYLDKTYLRCKISNGVWEKYKLSLDIKFIKISKSLKKIRKIRPRLLTSHVCSFMQRISVWLCTDYKHEYVIQFKQVMVSSLINMNGFYRFRKSSYPRQNCRQELALVIHLVIDSVWPWDWFENIMKLLETFPTSLSE